MSLLPQRVQASSDGRPLTHTTLATLTSFHAAPTWFSVASGLCRRAAPITASLSTTPPWAAAIPAGRVSTASAIVLCSIGIGSRALPPTHMELCSSRASFSAALSAVALLPSPPPTCAEALWSRQLHVLGVVAGGPAGNAGGLAPAPPICRCVAARGLSTTFMPEPVVGAGACGLWPAHSALALCCAPRGRAGRGGGRPSGSGGRHASMAWRYTPRWTVPSRASEACGGLPVSACRATVPSHAPVRCGGSSCSGCRATVPSHSP